MLAGNDEAAILGLIKRGFVGVNTERICNMLTFGPLAVRIP